MMSRKNLKIWHKKTAGLLKLHSTSPREHFGEKSWHVLVFIGAWTDFFTNSGQKPGQVCRNCIVSAQRSHLKKTVVFRKANSLFFVFGFLPWSFWALGNENIGMFVKTEFYPFTETFFEEKKLTCFTFFWSLNRLFYQFRPKTWGKSVGTAL